MAGHLEALRNKHKELEDQIFEENNRAFPDEALIHELKVKKLQIKDEIFQITGG